MPRGLLASTISDKLKKSYQRPVEAAVWRLAYANTSAPAWNSENAADTAVAGLRGKGVAGRG